MSSFVHLFIVKWRKKETGKRKRSGQSVKGEIGLLAKGIVSEWIPIRSLTENPYFKELVQHDLPTTSQVEREIKDLALLVVEELKESMQNQSDWTLVLSGMTENYFSTYGVYLTRFNCQHFFGMKHLSLSSNTAEFLSESTKKTLLACGMTDPLNNMIAAVTDNTNTLTAMKEMLKLQSDRRIIPIKCFLHSLNLVLNDIFEAFSDDMRRNVRLVKFIHCSHHWNVAVSVMQRERRIQRSLASYCKVRFHSPFKICFGICQYSDIFQHLYAHGFKGNPLPRPIHSSVFEIFTSDFHFHRNLLLCSLIAPITNAIGNIENGNTSLGFIFETFIQFDYELRRIYHHCKYISQEEIMSLLTILRERVLPFLSEESIYFVAFFLIPKYRDLALTAVESMNNFLDNPAHHSKSVERKMQVIIATILNRWRPEGCNGIILVKEELVKYMKADISRTFRNVDTAHPLDSWKDLYVKNEFPFLSEFALTVHSIRVHARVDEDHFSFVKDALTSGSENRMSAKVLNSYAILHYSLKSQRNPSIPLRKHAVTDYEVEGIPDLPNYDRNDEGEIVEWEQQSGVAFEEFSELIRNEDYKILSEYDGDFEDYFEEFVDEGKDINPGASVSQLELLTETDFPEEESDMWIGFPDGCGLHGLIDINMFKSFYLNSRRLIKAKGFSSANAVDHTTGFVPISL